MAFLLAAVIGSGAVGPDDSAVALQQDQPAEAKVEKKKKEKPPPDEIDDPDEVVDAGEPGAHGVWRNHPSIRFGTVFRLDFKGSFQEDAHASYPRAPGLRCPNQALPTTCTWQLHRNRVGIKGTLFKQIDYEVERELTEQELTDKDLLLGYTPKSQWKDVNVNLKFMKKAQIQVGKFKVPFGLDELMAVTHNDYAYRSLGASYLAPARDIGVMVHGSFFKRGLTYATGAFQHDGDNAKSKKIQGGNETFAARITATPFRQVAMPGLGAIELGTSFAISALSDDSYLPNGVRGRTILTQDTFYSSVYVKGHRRRWEADLDWTSGPVSARTEYTWMSDDRRQQGLGDEDLPDARAQSWYVSATWVLTGEPKIRPIRPEREFLRGGVGAVELAARYERLWFDSAGSSSTDPPSRTPRAINILPTGDHAFTIGLNWSLNRWVKLQMNGIRERVEDPARSPIGNGAAFWSQVARFQFLL